MLDVITYILLKQYIEDTLAGAGAIEGKSAYDIACDNGFIGTPSEWLASLKGDTLQIGPNGTWIINGNDTGIIVSPDLAGYATEDFVEIKYNEILKLIPEPPSYDEIIFDGGEI